MRRVLFFMVACGDAYHAYIPPFLHCLNLAYPESGLVIACRDKIADDIRSIINPMLGSRHVIYECDPAFDGIYHDGQSHMAARWLLRYREFEDYEFVYIGDIDVLPVREAPSLIERHLPHLQSSCHSNTEDIDPGLDRVTGLHCVRQRDYYGLMWPTMCWAKNNFWSEPVQRMFRNEKLGCRDNQTFLRGLMRRAGVPVSGGHFEYHGLHIGHSRVPGRWDDFFAGDQDQIRYMQALEGTLRSPAFRALLCRDHVIREIATALEAYDNR